MADFVQTMKDWARMCASIQGGIAKCDNCPLFKVLCQYKPNEKVDLAGDEKIIEKRDEDNPEPVYPTWAEWLNSAGLTKHDTGQFCVRMPNQYSYEVKEVDILNEAAYKPIPADIAEKLGIEPQK